MHSMFNNPHWPFAGPHRHHHRGGHEHPHPDLSSARFNPPFPPQPPEPPQPGQPGPWPGGFFPGGHRGGRGGQGFPGGFGFPGFPGFGPWGGGHGRGGGRGRAGGRQRRGNVRAAVLALLAERPMHGYEMIQEITERSNGLWRPSPGSVYPTLQLLADEGLVSSSEEPGGKKLFTLTEAGQAEAAKQQDAPPWQQAAEAFGDPEPAELSLHRALAQLTAAAYQMSSQGSPEQKTRAVEAVNEARRRIYAILGEFDEDNPESDAQP